MRKIRSRLQLLGRIPGASGTVLAAVVWLVLTTSAATAIMLESADGQGNTEAPKDDPGWKQVAARGDWSAVYLGESWVLTARHVGAGDVVLNGATHTPILGSPIVVPNSNQTATDLLLFRIHPEPDLPSVSIARSATPVGSPVTMIGRGFGRGERVEWRGYASFRWSDQVAKRWGTNSIAQRVADLNIRNTRTFITRFSIAGSPHEAHAAIGDSGGAVFARSATGWELIGIMLAVDQYERQPARTGAYGNHTFIADLAFYADAIESITHHFGGAREADRAR